MPEEKLTHEELEALRKLQESRGRAATIEKNENGEEYIALDKKEESNFVVWSKKLQQYFIDIDSLANYLCENHSLLTIIGKTKETLMIFNGKTWDYMAESFVKKKCEEILGKFAKINPVSEIIAKIKRRNHITQEEFDKTNINCLPLVNGIFNFATKSLDPHSPKNHFKNIIPIEYDSSAVCPNWLKFIEESLYPEDVPVLQEWFGFQLYRKYLIKKALIIFGEKDTGKTITLNALTSFIGEFNKTGLSLQKISNGTDFNRLSLKDKYSNIYDDLSSKDLNDGGNFKVATGGGFISGEEKFGDYSQFENYAKLTFATNKIPPVKDNDDMAYYSRWIVLRYDNLPEKKDLFLNDKIKKELSGILNWALEGLYRLLEEGEFSYKKTPEEVKTIMEMSGDPLIQFGAELLEMMKTKKITKEEMYLVYSLWANENKKPLLSKEQLGRRLNTKITYLVPKANEKIRFWDNVILKSEWKKKLDTLDTSKNNMSNGHIYKESLDIIKTEVSNPSNSLDDLKLEQAKLLGYNSIAEMEEALK